MSLFGGLNTQTQPQTQPSSSLFGNNTQNKPSLFGTSTTNNSQPQQSSSLFGGLGQPQQQQNNSSSLFGASTNQPIQTSSLFGQAQPQQNGQQQQSSGSLFGGLGGLGGGLAASTQNQNPFGGSLLNTSTTQQQQQPQNLQQSRLGQTLASSIAPRERSIPEQMEIILRKWSPESSDCLMKHYFYVNVTPGTAPFWGPGPDDNESEWEEALARKPSDASVPVLARGFQQLGARLNLQVQAVQQLQQRLHEMNNSLDAMLSNHELVLAVRAAEAKRKHIGLSQRCLGLAIKVQVLRSRGFVLDSAEEELEKKLAGLEKSVFDPAFAGREEEIWARMVALRERTGWLRDESEKLGAQIASGEKAGIDEEVLRKTKKILGDYDAQIQHLHKELAQVNREYQEWEAASRPT